MEKRTSAWMDGGVLCVGTDQSESARHNERDGRSKIADMRHALNVVTEQFESVANGVTDDRRADMTDMQLFGHVGRRVIDQHAER